MTKIDNSYTYEDDSKKQLLVIDPAARVAELDCFNYWQRQTSGALSYHLPALFGFSSLPRLDQMAQVAGVLLLGSGASVYDKDEWISPLSRWIEDYVSTSKPLLGICYGHQLIAHIYGGKVGFLHNDQSKDQGLRTVSMKESPINEAASIEMLVSHREIVTQIPDEFELWGSSESVCNDAMRHKTLPLYSLQAHPEATRGFFQNQSISMKYNHNQLEKARSIVLGFINRCFAN